jgi:hypothetical protein
MTPILALALLGAIAIAATLSGRLLVGALRIHWLMPFEPTRAAASAILGTAIWVAVFDRLSSAGLPAPRILLVLSTLQAALLAAVLARGDARALRPIGSIVGWIGILSVAGVTGFLALLPLLRTSGFDLLNDSYIYCAFSEWLQDHGFGVKVGQELGSPVSAVPALWQEWGFPLGASYALALVQASTGAVSIQLYPTVSAWGLVLAACGTWVTTRWVLSLSTAGAFAVTGAFALLPHSGYWAHHTGFLSQTYAVPMLLLGITTAARVERARTRIGSSVVLLSVLTACLHSVYVVFLPLITAAALAGAWAGLRRVSSGPLRARCATVHASTAVLFVMLIGLNSRPLLHGLPILAAINVGYAVPLSFSGFLSFAMGTRLFSPGLQIAAPPAPVQFAATGAAVLLGVLGLTQIIRRRNMSLLAVVATLVGLVGYQALVPRDPWSGQPGHTWNIFKAVQWAFPVTLLLQAAGAARLTSRRIPRTFLALLAVGVIYLSLGHWAWAERLGQRMRSVILEHQPLRELSRLRGRLQSLPPGELVLLGQPASVSQWLAPYTTLLAYPRLVIGDWTGSASTLPATKATQQAYAAGLATIWRKDALVLRAGVPRFVDPEGAEDLGGGVARLLDVARPRVVHVVHGRGTAAESVAYLQIGPGPVLGRAGLVVFSPSEAAASLRVVARSESRTLSLGLQVVPGPLDVRGLQDPLEHVDGSTVSDLSPFGADLPVVLRQGLTTLVLSTPSGVEVRLSAVRIVLRY